MSGIEKPAVSRKQMEHLRAEAARARRHYDLYKSANNGSKVTNTDRLHELKQESEVAQMRLIRARSDA